MWTLLGWSFVVSMGAVALPPALYALLGPTPIAIVVIIASFTVWCVLFARAWYLYGKTALWMLLSLLPTLVWPAIFGLLLVSCTYTKDCL